MHFKKIFMKNIKVKIGGMVLLVILTACQSQEAVNMKNDLKPEKTVVDHGIPQSTGPTTAPSSMKGPTTPPPGGEKTMAVDQAQAVTTNENIRLTLPRKTE